MGLDEELKEIKELLKRTEESRNQKKFKMPFGKKVGTGQAKKNWITVIKINENGHLNFIKRQIDEQTIMEDGVPRLATNQYVMFYKKNPVLILPSWSVEPLPIDKKLTLFSPKEHLEESLNNGTNTKGYKVLMAKMLKEIVNQKKPMGNVIKWIIGLAAAGIIGYAFISGGGK